MRTATTIPLAGASRFRLAGRRTRAAQLILCLLVLGVALWLVVAALRIEEADTAFAPSGTTAIVVLDVSASISSETYDRIAATLDRLAGSRGRYGLVLFSDTAYLALPPGAPAAQLRPFARFFRVPARRGGALPQPPRSPWTDSFSAGTRISLGLERALAEIREAGLRRPAVVLVSDLDDDTSDLGRLTQVALAYRRAGVPLRVVGLDPSPEDASFVRTLLVDPSDLVVAPTRESAGNRGAGERSTGAVVGAVLLALVLAGILVATNRVRWQRG